MNRVLMAACTFLLLVAACSSGAGEQDEATTTTEESEATGPTSSPTTNFPRPTVLPEPDNGSPTGVFVSDEIIDAALDQAVADSGVSRGDLEVELAMQVTWNDGSLGCPQPGRSYIQVLTDGYWVVVTHDGDTFDYRSSMDAEFRMCADGSPPVSVYEDR